jgi:hypothetical protein
MKGPGYFKPDLAKFIKNWSLLIQLSSRKIKRYTIISLNIGLY